MQVVLRQMNAVPGVFGGLACDADGRLLAQAFPPSYEQSRLKDAAAALADRTAALQKALGSVGMMDLRYAKARILVADAPGARLLFFCAPSVNAELLAMSLSSALRRQAVSAPPAAPAAAPAPRAPAPIPTSAPRELLATVRRIEAIIEASTENHFKLRGLIAVKAGFSLDLVDADTPDDPVRIQKLKEAASAVLGKTV